MENNCFYRVTGADFAGLINLNEAQHYLLWKNHESRQGAMIITWPLISCHSVQVTNKDI